MLVRYIKLEITPGIYRQYQIKDTITIGREDYNDIVLPDLSISGHHATIFKQQDSICIKDENSTNGTLVNHMVITQPTTLVDQDSIGIGCENLHFISKIIQTPSTIDLYQDKTLPPLENPVLSFSGITNDTLKILQNYLSEKIFTGQQNFIVTITNIVQSILGKNNDAHSNFIFQVQRSSNSIRIILRNDSREIPWQYLIPSNVESLTTEERKALRGKLAQEGIDCLEYSPEQNTLVLIKNLPTPKTAKTDFHIQYFSKMILGKHFPIDVKIANNCAKLDIIPVFPGCNCTPALSRIQTSQNSIKFWLTPLILQKNCHGHLQIFANGNCYQINTMIFTNLNRKPANFFLLFALWFPTLLILLDTVQISANNNIPLLLQLTRDLLHFIGGLTNFGFLMGIISLMLGTLLYIKAQPVGKSIKKSIEIC